MAAGTATVGAVAIGAEAAGEATSEVVDGGAMTSGAGASGAVPAAMPEGEAEVPISSILGWMGGGRGGDESVLIERAIST